MKDKLNPTLRETLKDMARPAPHLENFTPEPHDAVEDDFSVQCEGSITILWPITQAASDWMSDHLPEDCPRWGATGYAIETNYVADIIQGMLQEGLKT